MTTKEMHELQCGDIVMCNKKGFYAATDVGVPCEFLSIVYGTYLEVRVISGMNKGDIFAVRRELFDKVSQYKEVSESELTALFL